MTDGGDGNVSRGRQGRRMGYPKWISLDLTDEQYYALQAARYADGVPMADKARALLSLWPQDPAGAASVSIRAQEQLLAAMSVPGQVEPTAAADPPHSRVPAGPGVPPAS